MELLLSLLSMPWVANLGASQIESFLFDGGPVVWLILLVAIALTALTMDRLVYLVWQWPQQGQSKIDDWQARQDRTSWLAQTTRREYLAIASQGLNKHLSLIKLLIVVCPLLGLLGTVTGMIEVFEVVAQAQSENVRAMSAGISRATLPTMAGMLVAVIGLFMHSFLTHLIAKRRTQFENAFKVASHG